MDVSQVSFNNGKEYPTPDLPGEFEPKLKLIRKLNGSYYKIEQIGTTSKGTTTHTVERFVIRGLDTLLRKFVVVRTNDHSYFEMKTRTEEDAQRLFDMTTGRKLGASVSVIILTSKMVLSKLLVSISLPNAALFVRCVCGL